MDLTGRRREVAVPGSIPAWPCKNPLSLVVNSPFSVSPGRRSVLVAVCSREWAALYTQGTTDQLFANKAQWFGRNARLMFSIIPTPWQKEGKKDALANRKRICTCKQK